MFIVIQFNMYTIVCNVHKVKILLICTVCQDEFRTYNEY